MSKLFCFGLGYSAMALGRRLDTQGGWRIAGTCRRQARRAALAALGIEAALFDGSAPMDRPDALDGTTHVLLSAPQDEGGDPVLRHHAETIAAAGTVGWVGYL